MSRFEILQIGEDIEPAAGIPEGCELCGHCRMLRGVLPDGAPLPCGAAAPYDTRRERRSQLNRSSEQTIRGAS
jgi:hypothetical protein